MWFLLLYLFTAFLVLFLGIADIDFRPRLHMHRDSELNVMRQGPHTRSMDGVVPLGAGRLDHAACVRRSILAQLASCVSCSQLLF